MYRIRTKGKTSKGKKFVIEKIADGITSSRTLNAGLPLWEWACQDAYGGSVSNKEGEVGVDVPHKGVQDLLDEPSKEAIERTLSEVLG